MSGGTRTVPRQAPPDPLPDPAATSGNGAPGLADPAAMPSAPPAGPPRVAGTLTTGALVQAAQLLARALGGGGAQPSGLTGALAGALRRAASGPAPRSGAMPWGAGANSGSLRIPYFRRIWWAYGVAGILVLWLAGRVLVQVLDWGDATWTTLQYGDPRTSHLVVYFGLTGETALAPSLVTGVNDAGTAHIFVLPGGRSERAFVLTQALGEDPAGRAPLHLWVADADRDGHPDLLIIVGNTGGTYVFLLDTGKNMLRVPTPEERSRLVVPGTP